MSAHEEALAACARELRRRGLAPDTLRVVLGTGRRLLEATRKPLAAIVEDDARAFLAGLSRAGVARVTHGAAVVRLRIFFRALFAAGLVAREPTARLVYVEARASPQAVLSDHEVEQLMAAAAEPSPETRRPALACALALRDRACLELLYGVGLRRSEAGAARVGDLRLGDGSVLVRRAKRGESRALPLPRASIAQLRRYLSEARPVLAQQWKRSGGDFLLLASSGGPLGGTGVWQVVKRVGGRAGLDVAPHDFRRSIATHMVRDGVNVEAVRQVLGHSSLSTTARYVRVEREDLRKAVATLG